MDDEVPVTLERALGRIEGALRSIQDGITDLSVRFQHHTDEDTKRFDDHDTRIRNSERRIAYFSGILAILVGLIEYFKS